MKAQQQLPPRRRPGFRLARRFGLDRNPLRRRSDRAESALLLTAACLLVVAMAVGTVVGWHVTDAGTRRASAEQAARHRTVAVLLADTAVTSRPAGLGPAPTAVRARWSAHGQTYTGSIDAQQGMARGDTLTIWVDRRGRPVEAPYTRADAVADGAGSGFTVLGGTLLVAWIGWLVGRWRLDRARFAVWDDDWARVEPGWTGRFRR